MAAKRWGCNFVSLKGGAPPPSPPFPEPSEGKQSWDQKQLMILKEKLSTAEIQNGHLKKKIDNLTSAYTFIQTQFVSMQTAADEHRATDGSLQVMRTIYYIFNIYLYYYFIIYLL